MNSTLSKALSDRPTASTSSDACRELIAAMPVVIFYRAVREILRQRAHRRAVLQAFRR